MRKTTPTHRPSLARRRSHPSPQRRSESIGDRRRPGSTSPRPSWPGIGPRSRSGYRLSPRSQAVKRWVKTSASPSVPSPQTPRGPLRPRPSHPRASGAARRSTPCTGGLAASPKTPSHACPSCRGQKTPSRTSFRWTATSTTTGQRPSASCPPRLRPPRPSRAPWGP
ncbi:unnamed protein product [Ixodes hexagonus]